jgi:hypothetical protein
MRTDHADHTRSEAHHRSWILTLLVGHSKKFVQNLVGIVVDGEDNRNAFWDHEE